MRYIAPLRAAWGLTLLVMPGPIIGTIAGKPADDISKIVGRILGARQLGQALTLGRTRDPFWMGTGAAIDTLHSLSMVALAAVDPGHRRLAGFDAVFAGVLAMEEFLEARFA